MKRSIEEVFGVKKPIIAMCHLWPLPGDPDYQHEKGVSWIVDMAARDLQALQDGGVDAVMFSNERSMPWVTKVDRIIPTTMARVIAELYPAIKVPFGVDVIWYRWLPSILPLQRGPGSSVRFSRGCMEATSAFGR